jgi:hypothetical protein
MSVNDFKKRLDKCNADHEQQVKNCTNKELETKEAMEKAGLAHSSALVALKNAKETRISDRLKIAKEFIDNEIKVDLKLSKYDRKDVTKLMIELRQIRSNHATIEDRVEIAKRFWRLKSYFVKFPLLMRIKAALEKKKPGWKIEFRPNDSSGKKHWSVTQNWRIEKNTMEYPGLDEEWRGKFGDYQFGALYLGDTFLCGVTCEPRVSNNWRATEWSLAHTMHWFHFYHPTLLNDVTPQYWIQYSGVRPISFSNFDICAQEHDDAYRGVHSVNEIRAAAMDITPEFLIGEANKLEPRTLRDVNKEYDTPGDFRNMSNILSSICETGLFSGHYKGGCNYWPYEDNTDGYEPDPRTRRPMDENEIADAIIQHLKTVAEVEARRKAKEEEEKRIANLPKNSEEAIGIKYPWATKVEKVLDGRDGYSYFNVYCGGKHIMLCQRDNGYTEWKRDFDKDFKQLTDGQVKYYLTGKEK